MSHVTPSQLLEGTGKGTGFKVAVRNLLIERINDLKDQALYHNNAFTVQPSWLPWHELHEYHNQYPHGVLWLIVEGSDDVGGVSRSNNAARDIAITFLLQRGEVAHNSISSIDELDLLVEQLLETARYFRPDRSELGQDLTWTRNEVIRDEDERPFNLMMLKDHALYEAPFTAHYTQIL